MYKNHFRGFTLIELLVVIAIIGILSAVILASLNTARSKGMDAATQSNLQTIQTQAALDYSGNSNSYGTSLNAFYTEVTSAIAAQTGTVGSAPIFATTGTNGDPTIGNAINQAIANAGGVYYGANGTSFVVVAPLKAATGYWCVDSNGVSKAEAAVPATPNYGTTGTAFACI